jgi:hypothetical protein
MQQFEPLLYGQFYHIYNHAVGGRDLFRESNDYEHFLGLYNKYISSVADTYAWVLMKNHFHLLIKVKEEKEIGYYKKLNSDRPNDPVRFQTTTDLSEFGEPESVDVSNLKRPDIRNIFRTFSTPTVNTSTNATKPAVHYSNDHLNGS